MFTKRFAAGAAAATLVLTGLGSTVATPAFADGSTASAQCGANDTFTVQETVKVRDTTAGGPPGDPSPAPPKNGSERDRDRAIGLVQKGGKVCLTGRGGDGRGYRVGGACGRDGKKATSRAWSEIRFDGRTGWVPSACLVFVS